MIKWRRSYSVCVCNAAMLLALTCPRVNAASAAIPSQSDNIGSLFAHYPKNVALDYIISTHQNPSDSYFVTNTLPVAARPSLIFYGTWFLQGNPSVAIQCWVDDAGGVHTVRSVFNWAEQASGTHEVTSVQMQILNRDLNSLPKGVPSPPFNHLIIVSFYRNGQWVTRLYDRTRLPVSLKNFYNDAGVDPFWQPILITPSNLVKQPKKP